MPHYLVYEALYKCAMSRAGELGVDDEIDALDNHLVIFLLRTLIWRSRLAHKVV